MCTKLKLLKSPLKALNKKHFNHISAKAKLAREKLKAALSSLCDSPQDANLRVVVRTCNRRLLCYVNRKGSSSQRAKINFLIQGDKCSKSFHSLVKNNAKRNFITSLARDNGSITFFVDKIHVEFLANYTNSLGTKDVVDSFDTTVMNFTAKIFVGDALICGFSIQEIKVGLSYIGEDKSLGPNGYSSYFFQKSLEYGG